MQTVKAAYKGNKTIKLLEDVALARDTKSELTFEIPQGRDKTELGVGALVPNYFFEMIDNN